MLGFCLILVCCLFWFYNVPVVICNNMVNLSFLFFWLLLKWRCGLRVKFVFVVFCIVGFC